jgi:hypothetical protein
MLAPLAAHAADDLTTDPESAAAASAVMAGGLTGLVAAFAGVAVILGIIGLLFLILWIWALVDVLGRKFSDAKVKSTWTWLVILSWPLPVVVGFIPGVNIVSPVLGIAGVIIVLVYLFSIRKRGTK